MVVRIRLGSGIASLAPSPVVTLQTPDGATVNGVLEVLAAKHPALAPALPSALPVIEGQHVERDAAVPDGAQLSLLIPVAGGAPATRT